MPYWLTNADHGTMPVYDMGEVERVKKFGWTLLNVGESPVPVINGDTQREPEDLIEEPLSAAHIEAAASQAGVSYAEALTQIAQPKRKPGRPPKAK